MATEHGPWVIEGGEEVYRNPFIAVREDRVRQPDGQPGSYATVTVPPGVAVLALDGEGRAHLTRQFRYALGRESVEVVSGGREDGEVPLDAARRELREEVGIIARDWRDLGAMDLDTAIIRGPVRLFLARDLTFTATEREGTEALTSLRVPFEEAVRMVLDGAITHGPSCVLILKARQLAGDAGALGPQD
jgi:ADP-ribose pyrophosphatase